ncbi:MAG: hypothetical protein ACRDD1_12080, partial [Planctomycetia bacterium]
IQKWPDDVETREEVASQAKYTGSALHKTYPSPAGPPALHSDKVKCDHFAQEDWPRLLEALQAGIRFGFVGGFPERVWVWINDVLHEARLSNKGMGDYHGFPVNDERQYPVPRKLLEEAPRFEIPLV